MSITLRDTVKELCDLFPSLSDIEPAGLALASTNIKRERE